MLKLVISGLVVLALVAILIFTLLYFIQEKLIFFPDKLPGNYQFAFKGRYEEINFVTDDNTSLNSVLFKTDQPSKGVIFYLHGNAGTIDTWGDIAGFYHGLGYDVFMLDYRGYGKSEGSINSEKQFFGDVELAYSELTKRYSENRIIVLGYSIGTGAAARVAALHKPRLLILQAPYYSLTDLIQKLYPMVPGFFVKYKFNTAGYLKKCQVPVVIFHGEDDEIIYYQSSVRLKAHLKSTDTLITLRKQVHNGITENPEYQHELKRILATLD